MFSNQYKPTKLDNLLIDDEIINRLKKGKDKYVNYIFYGNETTSKTISAKLYFEENDIKYTENIDSREYEYLFVDDDEIIDSKTQNFIMSNILNYNIDNKNKYFLIISSDLEKIKNDIKENSLIINFIELNNEKLKKNIKEICQNENIEITNETIEYLINNYSHICEILDIIQSIHILNDEVSIKNITKVYNVYIEEYNNIINGYINKDNECIITNINKILQNGYNISDIIQRLLLLLKKKNNDKYVELISNLYKVYTNIFAITNINNSLQLIAILIN